MGHISISAYNYLLQKPTLWLYLDKLINKKDKET